MAIFEKKLLACEEMLERLAKVLAEADKLLDWDKDKANIQGAYQGVYCQELEEFIKENVRK